MTLGCGAAAGNATSDNIGPLNLINVKRIAYEVRRPEEAFESRSSSAVPDRGTVTAAVERYLAARGVVTGSGPLPARASEVVDRFLARRSVGQASPPVIPPMEQPSSPVIPPSQPPIVDFVSEFDVRAAIRDRRKIYIGPKSIITPSARDLAEPSDILVMARS
jgi:acetaldehyde dehydrogenase (acetylating)